MIKLVAIEVAALSISTTVTLAGVDTPKGEVHPNVASFGCGEAPVLQTYPLDA